MKKKIIKGMQEWQMLREFWELFQDYYIPEETDEYWDGMIKDFSAFLDRYAGTDMQKLTDCMARELMDLIERRSHV